MSLALWLWRIWYDSHQHKGVVVRANIRTHLRERPKIPGLGDFEMVDYAPGAVAMIQRDAFHGLEEMTSAEVNCCRRFLLHPEDICGSCPVANKAGETSECPDDSRRAMASG